MRIIDNINTLLGDDLKATLLPKSRLKIAASCFSIYAYEALKSQLSKIESLQFIFTAPTFIAEEATDKTRVQRGFKFKVQHPVLGYWRLLKKSHRVS